MAIILSPPPINERLLIRHSGEGRDPVFVSVLRKPGLDPGLRRNDGFGAIYIFRDEDLLVGASSAANNCH